MKVTVQSKSGELAFDSRADESILHAGLRQGLTLPYECATGTCGTCRARVMSGDVEVCWKEAPGGARLKADKGDILMCQTRARSDCLLRVPSEIMVADRRAPALRRGAIRDVRRLTGDVAHFDIHLSAPMSFEAGHLSWPWRPSRELRRPSTPGVIAVTSACESVAAGGILGLGYVLAGTTPETPLRDSMGTFRNIRLTPRPFYDTAKKRPRAPWR